LPESLGNNAEESAAIKEISSIRKNFELKIAELAPIWH
jgi:hypothetical protein